HMPRPIRARARTLSPFAFAASLAVIAVTHGSMPALATAGLATWAVAEVFGMWEQLGAFAVAAIVGGSTVARSGGTAATIAGAVVLTTAVGALPYVYGLRLSRAHARRERRVTRLEAHLSRATPAKGTPTPAALRRDVLLSVERTEATKDLATLD